MSGHIFWNSTIDTLNDVSEEHGASRRISKLLDVNRDVRGHTDEEIKEIENWLKRLKENGAPALIIFQGDLLGYKLGEELEVPLSDEDASDWNMKTTKALPMTVHDREVWDGIKELIGEAPIHSSSLLSVVEANTEEPNAGWGALNNVLEDARLGKHDWIILSPWQG